jgi:hypothetical protein
MNAFGSHFVAEAVDYEGCCTKITWASDKGENMGTGSTIDYIFASPGTRKITVAVTNEGGVTASDSITVNVVSTPPTVSIKKPTPAQSLDKEVLYLFEGTSFDAALFGPLPCNALRWDSNNAWDYAVINGLQFPRFGCNPEVVFLIAGPRVITLTGLGASGQSASAKVNITVLDPPANAPPSAVILQPLPNHYVDPGTIVSLKGVVTSPGNPNPISYKWVLEKDGVQTVIATGTSQSGQTITVPWTANVIAHPGGSPVRIYLYGTNSNNALAVAQVDIVVFWPPA